MMLSMKYIKKLLSATILTLTLLTSACSSESENTVLFYTAMPPTQIQAYENAIKKKYPELEIKWFQAGSESIATRIAMELTSDKVMADIVHTSDYFWFDKMSRAGLWDPATTKIETSHLEYAKGFTPPDHSFVPMSASAMVLAINKKFITPEAAPQTFQDIAKPQYKNLVSSSSPLESGTAYIFMTRMVAKYGYDYLKQLRDNEYMAAGGNSNTLSRLVSGERPIGVIAFDTIQREIRKNPDVMAIFPQDGFVAFPNILAITKQSKHKENAKKVIDFILSDEGQKLLLDQLFFTLDQDLPPPEGSKPLGDALNGSYGFNAEYIDFMHKEEEHFKDKFSEIVFH